MNLHGVASAAIGFVNPFRSVLWIQSDGFTTVAMKQVPQYLPGVTVLAQIQPLTSKDLRHLEAQNIQGVSKALYMNGNAHGVERPLARGGDMFEFDGQKWLVSEVFEAWPDWCKVGLALQGAN